jgi:hypothetical protein
MTRWLVFFVAFVTRTFRSRTSLQLEIAALRRQLAIYQGEGTQTQNQARRSVVVVLGISLVVAVEEGVVFRPPDT